jgi:hypothetical protein
MTSPYKLYIDPQGVKRGYYVYAHKDHATGEVFYVGKGNGHRAWETQRRNDKWKEMVASLTNGWDVEVVKQDLSEIEAFELEAELVEQYGGCAALNGTLSNWVPGGEEPLSIELGLPIVDGGWSAAYDDARIFKEFPRREEETIVEGLKNEIGAIISKLEDLKLGTEDEDNKILSDNVIDLEYFIYGLLDVSSDFLRRRVSWKDFALTLEETRDDLEFELVSIADYHKEMQPLLEQLFQISSKVFFEIDSGNRKEAEETATRITGRK